MISCFYILFVFEPVTAPITAKTREQAWGQSYSVFFLSFTCKYVVSFLEGFLFLLVLGLAALFNCGTP